MKENSTNVNVENVETVQTVETVERNNNFQQVIKNLVVEGGKRLNQLRIKNVNSEKKDNYIKVSFTLTTPVPGFTTDDNGETWKKGMINTIYTSLYAITGCLKEDEELSWIGGILNDLVENNGNTGILNLLFNGAIIDIIQQEVSSGEEYTNPFSSNNDIRVYDHDTIISHVIKFRLGKTGEKMADKLADKLMS